MKIKLNENERIDDLEYNDLKIIQNPNYFCFGLDSVLLSDFARNIKVNSKVLDLGTGTGIISILLTAKTKLKYITGIEIQEDICDMANRSIKLNNLEDKMSIINCNIKEINKYFEDGSIDVVVSNPPYKKIGTGIKNENFSRFISRHEKECNLQDIISVSSKVLKDNGELYMVHRPERLVDIIYNLRKYSLEPKTIRFVHSKEDQPPKLLLIKAKKNAKEFLKIEKPLIVYKDTGIYTNEILEIYKKEIN